MRTSKMTTFLGWVGQSAALVYHETLGRTRLLHQALRGHDRHDTSFDDILSANAEPTQLPEPLLRSKVG